MKKRGFTLAEVLITLGIIGIIAALTAPSLIISSRNEATAAKLATVMSNVENAFTTAIIKENVDTLTETSFWVKSDKDATALDTAQFAGNLNKYIHLNGFGDTTPYKFYDGNGPYLMNKTGGKGNVTQIKGNDEDKKERDSILLFTKNGAVMFVTPYANGRISPKLKKEDDSTTATDAAAKAAKLGGALSDLATILYIDVNGKAAPNTFGRDIFMFYVGNNGVLYPFGGVDVSIYETGDKTSIWTSDKQRYGCQDDNIKGGQGCTARIIEEGYKINY